MTEVNKSITSQSPEGMKHRAGNLECGEGGRRIYLPSYCLLIKNTSKYCSFIFPGGSDIKNLPSMQEIWVRSLGREDPWRREWLPNRVFLPGESHIQSMGLQSQTRLTD